MNRDTSSNCITANFVQRCNLQQAIEGQNFWNRLALKWNTEEGKRCEKKAEAYKARQSELEDTRRSICQI